MAIYVYDGDTRTWGEYEPAKAVVTPGAGFVNMAEAWVASDGVFFRLWPVSPPSAPTATVSVQPTYNATNRRYEFAIAWTGGGLYVTSWEVQRRQYGELGGGAWSTVSTILDETTLSYTELDGWGQQRYGYRIRGIGNAGAGTYSNEVTVDTLPQARAGDYPAITDDGFPLGDNLVQLLSAGFDNGQPSWTVRFNHPNIGPHRPDLAPYVYWGLADKGLTLRTTDGVAHQIDDTSYFNAGSTGPYYTDRQVTFDVPGTFPWSSDVVVDVRVHGFVNGVEWVRRFPHTFNMGGPGLPAAPAAVSSRHFNGAVYRVEWIEVGNASSYVVNVTDLNTATVVYSVEQAGTEVSPGLRRTDIASLPSLVVGHNYQASVAAKNISGTSGFTFGNGSIKLSNPVDFIPPLRQTWDSASGWIGAADNVMYQGYAFAMDYAVGMFGASPPYTIIGPAAIGYRVTCTFMQVFGKTIAGGANNPSLTGLVLHKCGSQFENFDQVAAIIGGHRESTTQNTPFALTVPTNYGDILIDGAANGYRGVAFWAPETSPQPAPHFQAHVKNDVIFAPNIVPLTIRIYHDG